MIAFGSLRLSLVFSLLGLANVSGFLDSFPPNTFPISSFLGSVFTHRIFSKFRKLSLPLRQLGLYELRGKRHWPYTVPKICQPKSTPLSLCTVRAAGLVGSHFYFFSFAK